MQGVQAGLSLARSSCQAPVNRVIRKRSREEESQPEAKRVCTGSLRSVSTSDRRPAHSVATGTASSSLSSTANAHRNIKRKPPLLEQHGGRYFARDADKRSDFFVPPSSKIRERIQRYQQKNLEVRTGAIHNRGVFLKQSAVSVTKGQVLAIYQGKPVSQRPLTAEERKLCGYPAHENIKYLVWSDVGGTPVLWERPVSYQASPTSIHYLDRERRRILIGVDAIDSPEAISHMNSHEEYDNIIMVVCLDPALIQANKRTEVTLKKRPDEQEYCFLIVANQAIEPGTELLMNYGSVSSNMAHFWAPDQYFFQPLCPNAVSVHFLEDGSTASISEVSKDKPNESESLRAFINHQVKQETKTGYSRMGVNKLIYFLGKNGYQNPFTGGHHWAPGDIGYLFERWNIEFFKKPKHLSYLYYCLNDQGKLDNNGINFIYAFIAFNKLAISPPVSSPIDMESVVAWLKRSIKNINGSDSKKQRAFLGHQLQELSVLKYRKMAEGKQKTELLQTERERLLRYIRSSFAESESENTIVLSKYYAMSYRFLSPSELWPDLFRQTAIWELAHIRCMALFANPSARVDPLDRMSCYHFNSREYSQALREALQRKQQEGATLEMVVKTINSGGLQPAYRRVSSLRDSSGIYQIPGIKGIPAGLRGTFAWEKLTPEHWDLLGFEKNSKPPLRIAIEKMDDFYSASQMIIQCPSLWHGDPDIKACIKSCESRSVVLLKHLAHKSGAVLELPDQQWQPMDTLRVCKPESDDYHSAMRQFLTEVIAKGKTLHEISALLNVNMAGTLSAETKARYSVDLPAFLVRNMPGDKTHKQWAPPIVSELIKYLGLCGPAHADLRTELQSVLKSQVLLESVGCMNSLMKRLRKFLAKNPVFTESLVDTLNIQPARLEQLEIHAARYIFSALGVEVNQPESLRDAFKPDRFDKLHMIANTHPDWHEEIRTYITFRKRHVKKCLNKSDQQIAEIFNSGRLGIRKKPGTIPIPLPPGCQADQWTAEVVKGCCS